MSTLGERILFVMGTEPEHRWLRSEIKGLLCPTPTTGGFAMAMSALLRTEKIKRYENKRNEPSYRLLRPRAGYYKPKPEPECRNPKNFPKNCQTTDEWLAAGGYVERIPGIEQHIPDHNKRYSK